MHDPSPPSARTAIVTGSARRVGLAIATTLLAEDWKVLVHARDAGRAHEACETIGAHGWVGADLESADAPDAIAEAARTSFGQESGLDLLVNSAASFERVDRWEAAGIDGWRRAMAVNARAPYLLTAELLPMLRIAGGLVVNISDHAAHDHWPAFPIHAASKAALESLTRSGAVGLAGDGVRMCAIAPGTIMPPAEWDADRIQLEEERGRLGTPEALIRTILELADDPARTGEIVVL